MSGEHPKPGIDSRGLTNVPGTSQVLDPEMPGPTVPGNDVSQVLFTGNSTVGNVPAKTITLYNNTNQTIYPFLYDANNGFGGGPYDPFDAHGQEYRLYAGYQSEGTNYLGLQAHSSISFAVPLVFWDSGRVAIATDGNNLLPKTNGEVNKNTNKNTQDVENPFHFEFYNLDNTPTQIATVGGVIVTDLQTKTHSPTGVLMYYHCSDSPGEDPGLDNPDQLIEFTIRDKDFLQKVSDYDQAMFGTPIDSGQIITLINYDVSYVDHLLLPIAMQANRVPVVDAVTGSILATPDFGWIGAANSYSGDTNSSSLQAAVTSFTGNASANGLGTYFGGMGWPGFFNPNYSPANANVGIRIPGGVNIFFDSPLANVRSSYNLPFGPLNHWMLSSGGYRPIQYSEAGVLSEDLQTITDGGDGTFLSQLASGTWLVTTNEHLDKANPNATVKSVDTKPAPGQKTITLMKPATGGLVANRPYSFIYFTPITDPYASRIRAIWYSWANYYAALHSNFADETLTAAVKADSDSLPGVVIDTRILLFDQAPPVPLAIGMQLTNANGLDIPSGTLITILKISADQKTVYLSQPVPGASAGQTGVPVMFSKPPVISTSGDKIADVFTIDSTKFGDFPGGVAGANQFAGNVYEVMSVFSTINPRKVPLLPGSMELIGNSIGGNVGFLPTSNYRDDQGNIVALKNISSDVRDILKSALRGVPDFTQFSESLWYPDPATATGGQTYNIFNLDPYVWFVHIKAGLSGYGFSFDDDAADVGANSTSALSIAVGGLDGLYPQQWFASTPYGSVSSMATIRLGTVADGNMPDGTPWLGKSLLGVEDPIVFYEVKPTDPANALDGAYVSSSNSLLPKGTQIVMYGPDLRKQEFLLSGNPPATTTSFRITFTGKPQ